MDDTRLERLTQLVGGRFKLTSLVQKRMQQRIAAASSGLGEPLVENLFESVLREIEQGQIRLELRSEPALLSLPGATEEKKRK
jgi:DNA-directed RNA polymerase subunit K/omega